MPSVFYCLQSKGQSPQGNRAFGAGGKKGGILDNLWDKGQQTAPTLREGALSLMAETWSCPGSLLVRWWEHSPPLKGAPVRQERHSPALDERRKAVQGESPSNEGDRLLSFFADEKLQLRAIAKLSRLSATTELCKRPLGSYTWALQPPSRAQAIPTLSPWVSSGSSLGA